ncbi:MAG: tetratricopeptide repeat protein [Terriglobales bacterium]|jgi:tetratricopeptide (TPR) repeat protein
MHFLFAALLVCLLGVVFAVGQDQLPGSDRQEVDHQRLDRQFRAASAAYDSGHFADAASQLESLLHEVPESFEVHELLGLTYSAESQDGKAHEHLEKAVRLKPDSAAARTNLAANLVRLGNPGPAEQEFKQALKLEPHNFDANHNLGEFYVQSGKISEATPFLESAQKINPASYDNGYDLALAYVEFGKLSNARQVLHDLLQRKNTAELHNLLAQIEEKDGKPVAAANEFEIAAHMDPSENNLFDWGSELLIHRTLEPAIEVFHQGAERYPNSPRLAIGLGMALYSRGKYDEAIKSLLQAADLNPSDPRCYLFLSRAYDSSPANADEVIERFHRFAELQPQNPRALYYYAMSLWKGKRAQDANLDVHQIESLLKKVVTLDPNMAEAHLQLGNLYSDQSKYAESIPEYAQALEHDSDLADAHYRLGQAYVHTGEKDQAQKQFEIYQQLRAQHLAEVDKQRAEIRQFVYSEMGGATATAKP